MIQKVQSLSVFRAPQLLLLFFFIHNYVHVGGKKYPLMFSFKKESEAALVYKGQYFHLNEGNNFPHQHIPQFDQI